MSTDQNFLKVLLDISGEFSVSSVEELIMIIMYRCILWPTLWLGALPHCSPQTLPLNARFVYYY